MSFSQGEKGDRELFIKFCYIPGTGDGDGIGVLEDDVDDEDDDDVDDDDEDDVDDDDVGQYPS